MPVRAVVFDLFDTLVDLRWEKLPVEEHRGERLPASARALHERVRAGAEVSFDDFLVAMREGARAFADSHYAHGREVPTALRFRDVLERLGLDDPALVEEMTTLHMGVLRSGVEAVAHHPGLLEGLRARFRLGLCSNFSHEATALAVLDEAGLREHLDPGALVVSDAFGLRKPRGEIFAETLARLDVAAEDAVHVGDSLRADVGGAAPVGLRTVWITRRVRDAEKVLAEHGGPRPDHVIADLAELPALLEALG